MKKRTKVILVLLLIIAITLIGSGVYYENKTNTPSKQSSEEILKVNEALLADIEIDGIKITDIIIKKVNDYYTYSYKLTNVSSTITDNKLIAFVFLDIDNNKLGEIASQLTPPSQGQSIMCEIRTNDKYIFDAITVTAELRPLIIE